MVFHWKSVTTSEGSAAAMTAALAQSHAVAPGVVIPAQAMSDTLSLRHEQIAALLAVRDGTNDERVASELKRTIITLRVPDALSEAIDDQLRELKFPILVRLSPIDTIANPLAPTIVLGLHDGKSVLDALRMLYAEMFTAENLAQNTDEHRASVIMQSQPAAAATFRIIPLEENIVIEATQGLGAWVGYGEPDRFLITNGELIQSEHGDGAGIRFENGFQEFSRSPITSEQASLVYEFAKPMLEGATTPLLFAATESGFICLGATTELPQK